MPSGSVTSRTSRRAPAPISSTARCPRPGSREPTYTVRPSAASSRAICLPMPLLAPVTRAVRSFMATTLPWSQAPCQGQSVPGSGRGGGGMARQELAHYLRDRRAALRPHEIGLAATGTGRRTPGLRREEVAELAHMSVDYYTRLEQARGPRPSARILDALARALRLTPAERSHLFRLAGSSAPPGSNAVRRVRPHVARMLERLPETAAIVTDAAYDVV